MKAPEIQQMYSLNMPVSQVRTKVRQEFERHRYVSQLRVVDMLLMQHHMEFQVCEDHRRESNDTYGNYRWGCSLRAHARTYHDD